MAGAKDSSCCVLSTSPSVLSGSTKLPDPSLAWAASNSCWKNIIESLLSYVEKLQELLRNKVCVPPGHFNADGNIAAMSPSNSSYKGADGAPKGEIRKSGGRGWRREKTNTESWPEKHHKETSSKTALRGNKTHLRWVPAFHKSSKEGNSSHKEMTHTIHLSAWKLKKNGKKDGVLVQKPGCSCRKLISSLWGQPTC